MEEEIDKILGRNSVRLLGVTSDENFIDNNEDKSHSSDNEVEDYDEAQHSRMLEAITSLEGKRSITQRSEPSEAVSEFALSEAGKQKVKVHELLSSLKQTANHVNLKRQLRAVAKREKVLRVPLSKPQAERVKRQVAYEKVSKQLKKWDSVVESNRLAEQVVYPLKQPDLRLEIAEDVVRRFQSKTSLETEVAKLLNESENVLTQQKELTEAEVKVLKAMSLEEAYERHKELQKMRALLSYQEAKARRQNKIKSKKYHRILKKERLRKQMKEFEELQKTNPKLAQEKLNEVDKQRIQERLTLKHRNTGKWAKQQMIRSKYNQESREALKEQLEIGRQLTEKAAIVSDSDDENNTNIIITKTENASIQSKASFLSTYNPWMRTLLPNSNNKNTVENTYKTATTQDFISLDSKQENETTNDEKNTHLLDSSENNLHNNLSDNMQCKGTKNKTCSPSKNKRLKKNKSLKRKRDKNINSFEDIDDIFDEMHSLKSEKNQKAITRPQRKSKKVVINENRNEQTNDMSIDHSIAVNNKEVQLTETLTRKQNWEDFENMVATEENSSIINDMSKMNQEFDQIDKVLSHGLEQNDKSDGKKDNLNLSVNPSNFVTVETKHLKSQVPDIIEKGDEDDEDDQLMTIAEAFADDDVVSEFKESKQSTIEQDKPKDIDLFLPGWGLWGGAGIKPSRKRRHRFLIKAPPSLPRKDQNLGNVIISEKEDKVASHQVNDLPFPFTSVHQFESSIRQPVGNTWNPESAFQKLIAAKVVTKLGRIIEPIDGDALLLKKTPQHKTVSKKKKRDKISRNEAVPTFLPL